MSSIGDLSLDLWLIPASAFTHEQEFTAPGTWTCPATTTWVEVIAVGGGGGGGDFPGGGGGGGGGVRRKWLPVSGPVPVTVGAGGTAAVYAPGTPVVYTDSTDGGTSAFGPLSPPVPASTFQVGGGGGGGGTGTVPTRPGAPAVWFGGNDAPTYGGGGGALGNGVPGAPGYLGRGYYGSPGPLSAPFNYGGGARATIEYLGMGIGYGPFGGGGIPGGAPVPSGLRGYANKYGSGYPNPADPTSVNGRANRGGGGAHGGDGGSGIVIVRWKE